MSGMRRRFAGGGAVRRGGRDDGFPAGGSGPAAVQSRSIAMRRWRICRWLGLTLGEGPDVGGPCGPYRQSERRPHFLARRGGPCAMAAWIYPLCTFAQGGGDGALAPHEEEPFFPRCGVFLSSRRREWGGPGGGRTGGFECRWRGGEFVDGHFGARRSGWPGWISAIS